MSIFSNPFESSRRLRGTCSCGAHASEAEHRIATAVDAPQGDDMYRRVVESALMRAIFPSDASRRAFLTAVGSTTASAVLASVFPIATATEAFAEGGPPEKKALKVGFIPITCATPIIMAAPMGFYAKQGLDVEGKCRHRIAQSAPDPGRRRHADGISDEFPTGAAPTDGLGWFGPIRRESL